MFLWERIFRTRRPNRFLRVAYDVVARHVSDHGHRRLPDQYQPRFIHTRDSRIGPCLVKMIQWARWFRGVYAGISFEYCASVRSMRNATTTLRNARKREREEEGGRDGAATCVFRDASSVGAWVESGMWVIVVWMEIDSCWGCSCGLVHVFLPLPAAFFDPLISSLFLSSLIPRLPFSPSRFPIFGINL